MFVDLEQSVIDDIRTGPYRQQFSHLPIIIRMLDTAMVNASILNLKKSGELSGYFFRIQ